MRSATFSRRVVLQGLAAGACFATVPAFAKAPQIDHILRLSSEARSRGPISQRIDYIAGALKGTSYKGFTLIGGPHRPEQFVMRDDAFDCVTYCETVLAAAIAHDRPSFETALREIRYHNGVVSWRERNHYFFEWGQHNIENKTCRAVTMDGAVSLDKTVFWHRDLGKRHFAMSAIPRDVFLKNKATLENGDIVGFVTLRRDLDYFHIGFISHDARGGLLLRHASQRHYRVLDERMETFLAANHVRYVTLLRPEESATVPATVK